MGKSPKTAPLYAMTIEDFTKLLDERIKAALSEGKSVEQSASTVVAPACQLPQGRYVYGLRGIEELFGVSHKTAQYYKDNIISAAVRQNGRKIVTDVEKALKLFNERRAK